MNATVAQPAPAQPPITTTTLFIFEALTILLAVVTVWLTLRAQDRKRRREVSEESAERHERQQKFQEELRAVFHSTDKRLHGIEVVVQPYVKQLKELEQTTMKVNSTVVSLEARTESQQSEIERINRQLERLQSV